MRLRVRDLQIWDFDDANERLNGQDGRRLCGNTQLIRTDPDTIVVRLHWTDIVTYKRDGRIILHAKEWRSSTTKHWINRCTPPGYRVYQRNHEWKVRRAGNKRRPTVVVDFHDGIELKSI